MNRRQFLGASALGAAALLAGCSESGGTEPAPRPPDENGDGSDGNDGGGIDMGTLGPAGLDIEVQSFDYGPGEDGNLTVTVEARNTDDEAVTLKLVQSVTVEGERLEETRTLSFEPEGSETVTLTFDVAMDTFENASSTGINGPEWEWPEDATTTGS